MIIAGNWKMNLTLKEGQNLVGELKKASPPKENTIILFPPFTMLYQISSQLDNLQFFSGSQDCSSELEGAFTSQISVNQIKDAGCSYVLLGHSERRKYNFETDEIINKKAIKSLSNNITPIICVGENLENRQAGDYKNIIKSQIEKCLKNLDLSKIIIAYEPVWAIGTGLNASNFQIEEVHNYILEITNKADLKILYGGSVNEKNYEEILNLNSVSGVLVGGASLVADKFLKIMGC
jgi:triosephosphate isomerase